MPRGPWPPPPGPVQTSHKKDGRQRRQHRFHVSCPPPYPASGSDAGFRAAWDKQHEIHAVLFGCLTLCLQGSPLSPPSPYQISYWSDISEILVLFIDQLMSNLGTKTTQNMYDFEKSHLPHTVLMGGFLGQHFGKVP